MTLPPMGPHFVRNRVLFALLAFSILTGEAAHAQSTTQHEQLARLSIDSLLKSPGPAWQRRTSAHFVLYTEQGYRAPAAIVDSLERAWNNAVALLGEEVRDTPGITVLVTASRTRFPTLMTPATKGLQVTTPRDGDLIILVQNDSVRAYTRHEVMHAIVNRTWRHGAGERGMWLGEGIATFADGTCQGASVNAVARDVLRRQPTLSVSDMESRFGELAEVHRSTAYVVAASLVDYVWSTRGRDAVRRLRDGTDSLSNLASPMGTLGIVNRAADVTRSWRAFVEERAKGQPGLDQRLFERHGCG